MATGGPRSPQKASRGHEGAHCVPRRVSRWPKSEGEKLQKSSRPFKNENVLGRVLWALFGTFHKRRASGVEKSI